MRFIVCCVALNAVLFSAFSQSTDTLAGKADYIINHPTYKKGIYKSFVEFKYDNPSIAGDLMFDGKRIRIALEAGKETKIKRREVWGFSDGKRVYIRWNKYNEVTTLGRYCYFEERGTKIVTVIGMYPPFILPLPLPYRDRVILNYNTGRFFILTKKIDEKNLENRRPGVAKTIYERACEKEDAGGLYTTVQQQE